jgi:hypothetical protein
MKRASDLRKRRSEALLSSVRAFPVRQKFGVSEGFPVLGSRLTAPLLAQGNSFQRPGLVGALWMLLGRTRELIEIVHFRPELP